MIETVKEVHKECQTTHPLVGTRRAASPNAVTIVCSDEADMPRHVPTGLVKSIN